jgi:hypothetical protein
LTSGSLPPGLTQSGTSVSGTPTQPGNYTFTEQVIDGRNNASGTAAAACSVNVIPAQISGLVYTDVNDNKVYDPGTDTPLGGVTVTFQGPGGVNVTTVSASNGTYSFANKYTQKGGYHVQVPGNAGNNQHQNTPGNININLVAGQNYPNNNFGYKLPGK